MNAITNGASKTYTTSDARGLARPSRLGLSLLDVEALKDFFRWHAARCGFRSGQGAFEASCSGMTGCTSLDAVHEDMLTVVGYGANDNRAFAAARRVERALREMEARGQGLYITVLFLLYGEPPVGARVYAASFADVWQIAHLTDAAEAIREHYALHEGNEREERIDAGYDETEEQRRTGLETLFWECAGRIGRLERQLARPRLTAPRRLEAERKLAGWERTMATTLRAFQGDGGRLRARLSAMAGADREISTTEALRRRLKYAGPVDANGKPNKDAHAAWLANKAAFEAEVRLEADLLRVAASGAYVDARRAVAAVVTPK